MYVKSDFILQKYLVTCLCQYHGHCCHLEYSSYVLLFLSVHTPISTPLNGINSFQFLSSDVNKNFYFGNYVHKCAIFVLTGLLPCCFGRCSGNYRAS